MIFQFKFKGQSIEDIPSAVLEDCVQLVKANSIEGKFDINLKIFFYKIFLN